MNDLSKWLSRFALWSSATGLVIMTLIICWQVFARYVLGASPAWAEQASLFLMLWFILFAAAAGVREGFHIRLSLLQDSLPSQSKKRLVILCHLIVLLFGLAMAWSGAELVYATWHHDIPTLGIPRGTAYIPLSAAGALIAFFSIEHVMREQRGEPVEPLWS